MLFPPVPCCNSKRDEKAPHTEPEKSGHRACERAPDTAWPSSRTSFPLPTIPARRALGCTFLSSLARTFSHVEAQVSSPNSLWLKGASAVHRRTLARFLGLSLCSPVASPTDDSGRVASHTQLLYFGLFPGIRSQK